MINKLRLLLLTLFVSFALVFTGCNMGQKQEDPNPNGTEQENKQETENAGDENTDNENNPEESDKTDDADDADNKEDSDTDEIPVTKKDPYADLSSVEMAKAMTIGWNLGNTLDAHGKSGLAAETYWGQPKTTQEMIKGVRAAGFKTIRIPVSWHDHMDSSTYKIDEAWMGRVKTVVDWALEEDLIVILNLHHDNVAESKLTDVTYALSKDEDKQNISKKYISEVWSQVSATFKDYGNNLVFELLNEPRDIAGEVWGNEWWVDGANAQEANEIITAYEQVALDVIRKSGGKNATRFCMAPNYAAASGSQCRKGYTLPADTAKDKMIFAVHAYSPYDFAMEIPGTTEFTAEHKEGLSGLFDDYKTNFVDKGIGVVIGETGATNKNNDEARIKWAAYFFGEAYKRGMTSVLWDNGASAGSTETDEKYGYYNRTKQTWYSPDLIKAAMDAVGVTGYSIPASE